MKASDQSVWYEGTDEQSASSGNNNFLTHDGLDTGDNLTKFWKVEGSTPVQITDVQGRFKQKLPFLKEVLQAPPPVLDCIEHGYRLLLKYIPQPFSQQNHKSTELRHVLVQEALFSLLEKRYVRRVDHKPYVCSPLSIVSNTAGKLRLVLNLRYVNQFLHVIKFKYEDLRIAALMFEPNEYLFKFDLKSGFHHVDIHPDHFQFLGFQWEKRGVPSYYVFTVLPFGLSTASYVFTKLMRPLVRFWQGKGLKVNLYLDDEIVNLKGEEQAINASTQVKINLENAGFIINAEKSIWAPSQAIEWLGFHIELNRSVFAVPSEKIESLKSAIKLIKEVPQVPARLLASVIGKIITMSLGLGPVTRLMTRSLYAHLNCRTAWCQKLNLNTEALQELEFWDQQLLSFNGQFIWPRPSAVRFAYSDASRTGYGGYIVEHGKLVANGQWSEDYAAQSSTWHELRAVRLVLESFEAKLKDEWVRWFIDHQNVIRIVQHGSGKLTLQVKALTIFFNVCKEPYSYGTRVDS